MDRVLPRAVAGRSFDGTEVTGVVPGSFNEQTSVRADDALNAPLDLGKNAAQTLGEQLVGQCETPPPAAADVTAQWLDSPDRLPGSEEVVASGFTEQWLDSHNFTGSGKQPVPRFTDPDDDVIRAPAKQQPSVDDVIRRMDTLKSGCFGAGKDDMKELFKMLPTSKITERVYDTSLPAKPLTSQHRSTSQPPIPNARQTETEVTALETNNT